ncbi:linoleoyl-CoA desaturase [Snodgrassella communis]|uniref:Delta 5 fatty acid desaturase n=3 Tax=Snodgrassella communis TaxID=2946699 RepID=A0A836Z6C3_9NEIS|nr:acyl-CoA desaturase [Snodgrassella communis]KDN15535.1 Delta 5 fatty acid desaturase [Snodgrassella communis]PIT07211.1 linoleoyl-CoA desaturase [Snodgrassella communis]PIT26008.1 linoleoyl-CoA desaturase [Snodgrassella communis]PIT27654.1 linoleoyl-CoA desaturase [Snodgrassella communis]PIT31356.1 linoleoyl-CoA desaturase [Snodgrassella communis]
MSTKPLAKLHYAHHDEQFHQILMAEAKAYLAQKGDHRFANSALLLKNLLLLLFCVVCYLLSLHQVTIGLFALCYFGFVMSAMLANINAQHDACHNVLFRSRLANRIFGRLVTLPLGLDPHYWQVRHVDYHHIYPNIQDYDLDMEENGVFRQTPFQKWYPHMRFQPYYWPFIAGLSLPYIAWVFDWSDQLGKTPLAADKKTLTGIKGWALFLGSKILHFIIALIVPILILSSVGISWYSVLWVYLITQMVSSFIVVCLLLGTHWADPAFYTAPADNQMEHGWYHQQFTTCCDWYPSPKIFNELLGGLNLHLTHHLFPGWSHRHYPALMLIIERLAQQYQLPYRRLSYVELLIQQQQFIRRLAQKPDKQSSD